MAATRSNPTFQIYQDTFGPHSASKPRPQLQPSAIPLQPLGNMSQGGKGSCSPVMAAPHHISPLKSQPMSPQLQQFPEMNYVTIAAPMQPSMYGISPVKQPHMQQYQQPLPSQPMFSTFNSNLEAYPRQYHVLAMSQNESSDFPVPPYARRQNLKRSFSDAAAAAAANNERPTKKLRLDELPNADDMPLVEDDGNKPGYSYAQMIGMAILRAPNRRLTLAQIYEWISSTFAFYREDPKQGWHNSIRHNLSLNKAFKKQERPKGDAGKGSYWIIEPGMEPQFFKEKARKAPNLVNMGIQNGMRADIHVMAQPLAEAMTPSWSVPVQPTPFMSRPQTAPTLPELSSDATLPASDPALHEDPSHEGEPQSPHQASSPINILNSSPPVASNHHRTISSPVIKRPTDRPHRRRNTAIDDSGYWTELSSSVRKTKNGIMLTSEINIEPPNGARGRAEDAIRRILSSPRATPNPRRFSVLPDLDTLSSPMRNSPISHRHPATPAVIFKKPAMRPPQSVSPNTQLQRHRAQMLEYQDSPIKGASIPEVALPDLSPYSSLPTFRDDFEDQFFIFEDTLAATSVTPGFGSSPLKSVRKPSLLRSNTSAGILRDSSSRHLNAKTPTKSTTLKPAFQPISLAGSPLKKSMSHSVDDDLFGALGGFDENTFVHDDIFDTTLLNDENSSELGDDGVDLSKGFAFIGQSHDLAAARKANYHQTRQPSSSNARPILGMRSNTSAF